MTARTAAGIVDKSMRRNWNERLKTAPDEVAGFIFELASGATLGAVVPPPGLSAKCGGSVSTAWRFADRGRSNDRHGANRAQLRGRSLECCAGHFGHGQRTFERICTVGRSHRDEKSCGRDRGADQERSCTALLTMHTHFASGRTCRVAVLQKNKLVQAADSGREGLRRRICESLWKVFAIWRMSAMFVGLDCFGQWNSSQTRKRKSLSLPGSEFCRQSWAGCGQARVARLSYAGMCGRRFWRSSIDRSARGDH